MESLPKAPVRVSDARAAVEPISAMLYTVDSSESLRAVPRRGDVRAGFGLGTPS